MGEWARHKHLYLLKYQVLNCINSSILYSFRLHPINRMDVKEAVEITLVHKLKLLKQTTENNDPIPFQ